MWRSAVPNFRTDIFWTSLKNTIQILLWSLRIVAARFDETFLDKEVESELLKSGYTMNGFALPSRDAISEKRIIKKPFKFWTDLHRIFVTTSSSSRREQKNSFGVAFGDGEKENGLCVATHLLLSRIYVWESNKLQWYGFLQYIEVQRPMHMVAEKIRCFCTRRRADDEADNCLRGSSCSVEQGDRFFRNCFVIKYTPAPESYVSVLRAKHASEAFTEAILWSMCRFEWKRFCSDY